MTTTQQRFLLIVNGKSAGNTALREAVAEQRKAGMPISVRVTWEAGDAAHFAEVAVDMGMTHVVACGGDGTVNEVINGLMRLDKAQRPVLGVVPLGSANDFATSVGLPLEPKEALSAAWSLSDYPIDVVKLCAEGDTTSETSYYVNMMTGGFGAEITSSTPKMLKRMLGGGAYSLMGAVKAWRHRCYRGTLHWRDQEESASLLLLAIGNGRQSGGGQVLAPKAKLDDGLLDVLVVKDFLTATALPDLVSELQDFPREGRFVRYLSVNELSVSTLPEDPPWPLTLDGEARHYRRFRAEVVPLAVRVILPDNCPLLTSVVEV
ncbi:MULTISPECIES: lipid kinase YegS [unclassified Halomonas]|uniref:lipid kinase YegS n=1 Tax=unclassified Halomonas TaxID=2609666 RepID=UPI0006DB1BB1|nr:MULTISPECIES: lipid kinase YegS [unclassified Halomonas]KPQ21300.1 MAG: lipid kinase YegS [Halomonas sp. HL-93]SBR49735.1 lipid kinase YegS [Halomonas sp. HL-93]SNY96508.1 lipid kinase YegS [Halomonas sp. hl-4]